MITDNRFECLLYLGSCVKYIISFKPPNDSIRQVQFYYPHFTNETVPEKEEVEGQECIKSFRTGECILLANVLCSSRPALPNTFQPSPRIKIINLFPSSELFTSLDVLHIVSLLQKSNLSRMERGVSLFSLYSLKTLYR